MPTGDLPEQEQPRSRPLAYEPPSWDAYFGKADEAATADQPAVTADARRPGTGAAPGTGQRFAPTFDATQAIDTTAAYPPQPQQGAPARAPYPPQGQARAPYPPQPVAPGPYGQQPAQAPVYQQLFGPANQQSPGQPPQSYGQPPQSYGQPTFPPQPFGTSSYEEQPFGGPGDGGSGRRPPWVIPVVIVVVAAAFGIALGAVFGLGSDNANDPGTASATPTPTPSDQQPEPSPTAENSEPPQEVTDSHEVPAEEAKATLAEQGLTLRGEPRAGWSWTDANGLNVVYVTREQVKDEDDKKAATVRVLHAAHLDGDPDVLRTMQDPGQGNCELNLLTDFTPSSITVTDADGDGIGEATVGWYYACRSDPGPFDAKLALISGGDKYILRGVGIPEEFAPSSEELRDMPKVSFTPSPKESSWIDGTYDTTADLFRQLYVGGTAE